MNVIAYEKRLDADLNWALREGSMHFNEDNEVFKTLRRICKKLDELAIPYAIVGGMAMFLHGYRRFTEDVDLLVNREGLKSIHDQLEGRGYIPPFAGSKQLRDTDTGVRIEFLVTGEFPGDGKPKPVVFPEPMVVATEVGGMSCLQLEKLIELKLASGTAPGRMKDLGDVESLIRELHLPASLADQIDTSVREKYLELWTGVQIAGDREP